MALSINWERAFQIYKTAIARDNASLGIQATLKLAYMSNHAPENILTRAVPILVELLGSSSTEQSPSVQEAAAFCLKRIACQGDGRLAVIIGQCGAIPSLLTFLQDSEGSQQIVFLKCLRNIVTFGDVNRMIVLRNSGLEIILSLLNANSGSLRWPLLEILSALALIREARRAIFNARGTCFLVESARCGTMISRTRAAQAIGLLGMVKRTRQTLVHSGAIDALVVLIRNGDTSAKLVSANALGVISSHVDCIRPVAQAGAIPLFAEILERGESMGKEIAEDVFCILAVVEENACTIFEHLIRILRGTSNEAKIAAADVLWDLSSYKHLESAMQHSGIIPECVELLRDGSSEIQEKISGAVAQLSYNGTERLALADSGAIPLLIDLLQDESEELRDNAAEALVNFTSDPLLGDRISCILDNPSFQQMQDRLLQIRASHAHLNTSLRQMTIDWDSGVS